jgi:hypothetical protein
VVRRILVGVLLGALVVVVGAYVHDARVGAAGGPDVARRVLVNWDAVQFELGALITLVKGTILGTPDQTKQTISEQPKQN